MSGRRVPGFAAVVEEWLAGTEVWPVANSRQELNEASPVSSTMKNSNEKANVHAFYSLAHSLTVGLN